MSLSGATDKLVVDTLDFLRQADVLGVTFVNALGEREVVCCVLESGRVQSLDALREHGYLLTVGLELYDNLQDRPLAVGHLGATMDCRDLVGPRRRCQPQ